MDRFLTATGLVLTLVVGVLSLPGPALAGGNGQVAKAECRNDRRTDKADFVRDYGRGKASMLRCVRSELRKARRECRVEKRLRPGDFTAEYGKGKRAMVRCVRDKLN